MTILLTLVHVIVALFLIVVVLLQTGKRADLAGAFGGGGSQTAFGARGAVTVLSKATTVAAVLFMITSMSLAVLSARSGDTGGGSVLDEVKEPATETPADTSGALPELPPATGPSTDGTEGTTEGTEPTPSPQSSDDLAAPPADPNAPASD